MGLRGLGVEALAIAPTAALHCSTPTGMALSGGSGAGEFQTRSAEKVDKSGRVKVSGAMEDVVLSLQFWRSRRESQ